MQKTKDKYIPMKEELLSKYKSVKEIFNNEKSNYDGIVKIENYLSELENVDILNLSASKTKQLAKTIFYKYNSKNTFENNGNKIIVSRRGIDERINKIFESKEQRNLLKEHLMVFSDLGDIIEHATLVSQSKEKKSKEY